MIKELESQENFYEDVYLRRKVITHKMAIQQKEIKQLHIKRSLALCTHMIYRRMLKGLGLASTGPEALY